MSELQGLQTIQPELERRGARLIAISSGSPEEHADMARSIGATFSILSDPDGETIRAWGLYHDQAAPGFAEHVARPAIYVIGRDGVVRDAFLTENWRVRERPDQLLERLSR